MPLRAAIVLSSDSDAIQQAFSMGVCHGLEKPFDLEALLSLVVHVISDEVSRNFPLAVLRKREHLSTSGEV